MKNRILSSQSATAIMSSMANVANVLTPVLVFTTPDGAVYDISNHTLVRGVDVKGVAIIADLRNSNGDRIRAGSLFIGSASPADEFTTQHRSVPLTTWADLDTSEQKNENFKATIASACDLNFGDVLVLPRGYQLVISINSPEVIDWSKSYLEIPAIEENK